MQRTCSASHSPVSPPFCSLEGLKAAQVGGLVFVRDMRGGEGLRLKAGRWVGSAIC